MAAASPVLLTVTMAGVALVQLAVAEMSRLLPSE
jgi:hypothetical protein